MSLLSPRSWIFKTPGDDSTKSTCMFLGSCSSAKRPSIICLVSAGDALVSSPSPLAIWLRIPAVSRLEFMGYVLVTRPPAVSPSEEDDIVLAFPLSLRQMILPRFSPRHLGASHAVLSSMGPGLGGTSTVTKHTPAVFSREQSLLIRMPSTITSDECE